MRSRAVVEGYSAAQEIRSCVGPETCRSHGAGLPSHQPILNPASCVIHLAFFDEALSLVQLPQIAAACGCERNGPRPDSQLVEHDKNAGFEEILVDRFSSRDGRSTFEIRCC